MGPHFASHTLPDDDDDLDDDFDEDEDDDEDGDDDDDDEEAEGAYRLASRPAAWLRPMTGVFVPGRQPGASGRRSPAVVASVSMCGAGIRARCGSIVEPRRIPGRTREFHSEG
jgi:hypothetical protein